MKRARAMMLATTMLATTMLATACSSTAENSRLDVVGVPTEDEQITAVRSGLGDLFDADRVAMISDEQIVESGRVTCALAEESADAETFAAVIRSNPQGFDEPTQDAVIQLALRSVVVFCPEQADRLNIG